MTTRLTRQEIQKRLEGLNDSDAQTFLKNLNVDISNKLTEPEIQKLANDRKVDIIDYLQKHIVNKDSANNIFFLTMHFKHKQKDIATAKEKIREFLSPIHNELYGRKWYNHLYPGFTVIEHGKTGKLHTHTIININNKTVNDLKNALDYVDEHNPYLSFNYSIIEKYDEDDINKNFACYKNHLFIEPVTDLENLIGYTLKEYNLRNDTVNFDNFFPHPALFDIAQISRPGWKKSAHIIKREYAKMRENAKLKTQN